MKRFISILIIALTVSIININVHAEDIYNIKSQEDIDNIQNIEGIREIKISNMTLDDLSFLENYKDIDKITISNSTININNLSEELINKIIYNNSYLTGEYNILYRFKESDKIVNTEYSYNKNYDDEFNRMAKYIYKDKYSDREIIKYVTLFVLDYMSYDKNSDNSTALECYNHYGTCSNYTELESVLLSKLGIYAITINGYTNKKDEMNSGHSWNMVYLDDTWYVIDPVYLDLYDSSDAIKKDLSVEYYMKEITRDFKSTHIAYYNYENIPTDFLESRMSILDILDEIGDYTPVEQEVAEPVVDEVIYADELKKVIILLLIAIIVFVYTIKDKKKLREKITR